MVADNTVVGLTPNHGDSVQMIKAGILEIADVFVVNKADIDGHLRVIAELRAMLNLSPTRGWKAPIIATVATRQDGVEQLWEAVLAHRRHLQTTGRAKELAEKRLRDETAEVAADAAPQRAGQAREEDARRAEGVVVGGSPYRPRAREHHRRRV